MPQGQACALVTWPGSVVIDGAGLIQNRLQVQRREDALRWCCRSIVATVHSEFGGASETTRGGERSSREGESCGAGHGAMSFDGKTPRAAPLAVIDGTDFLELAS